MKHEIIKELLNFMDGLQDLDSGICDEVSGNAIMDYGMQKKKLIKDTADRIIELFKKYIREKQDKSELEDVEDSIQKYKNDLKNRKEKKQNDS